MSAFFVDGDFTVAVTIGKPRLSFPIDGDLATFVIEQDFMQYFANFSPATLSAAHPVHTTSYLIGESQLTDLGGGVARWTRSWSKIPANRSEYDTTSYNFIGFAGYIVIGFNGIYPPGVSTVSGRPRMSRVVLSKTDYVYYLPGVTPGVSTVSDITVVTATRYLATSGSNYDTDWLTSDPPFAIDSSPSRSTYDGWITSDAASASSFSIVAEASRITRWKGNIWERATRYVKAT